MEYIVVLVTAADTRQAETISRALLEKKLAACCNILGGVRSLYWWEGRINDDQEVLLVIKSCAAFFDEIKGTVIALHSNAVPEIIALPITAGSEAYLQWIDRSLRS